MASNSTNAHGLQFVRRWGGGPEETRLDYNKLAGLNAAIYINDVVTQIAGDATFGKVVSDWPDATPGTTIPLGVSKTYSPALTAAIVAVNIDPMSIYEAEIDSTTNGFTAANEDLNVNVGQQAGNATTKISGQLLNESTLNVSASRDCHTVGLYVDNINYFTYGKQAAVEVIFNHHKFHPATVAV